MPELARYASAFFATLRGSRLYASRVIGSWMKKLMFSVLWMRNGSRYALLASGSNSMSDSLIAWKPRMDDPSKPRPSVKVSGPKVSAGMVKCCMTPGRSQNRTSTNFTSLSRMYAVTSSGLLNIDPPGVGGQPHRTLRARSSAGMTLVFPAGDNARGRVAAPAPGHGPRDDAGPVLR